MKNPNGKLTVIRLSAYQDRPDADDDLYDLIKQGLMTAATDEDGELFLSLTSLGMDVGAVLSERDST